MVDYDIRIFSISKRDLIDIVDYVNTLSPTAAMNLYDSIIEKISALRQMPERCPFVKDVNLRLRGYRVLIAENYLVFFIIDKRTVCIRRIIYGKRNFELLL
jgi:toxin ParE1/3/4